MSPLLLFYFPSFGHHSMAYDHIVHTKWDAEIWGHTLKDRQVWKKVKLIPKLSVVNIIIKDQLLVPIVLAVVVCTVFLYNDMFLALLDLSPCSQLSLQGRSSQPSSLCTLFLYWQICSASGKEGHDWSNKSQMLYITTHTLGLLSPLSNPQKF